MKAIVLLSGGLDSRLAIRLMQEQEVELEAVNFFTIFCTCTARGKSCPEAVSAARSLGVPLQVFEATEDLMKAVEDPRFGYGRAVNPCLDCRVIMLRKAARYMRERGASFIVTGDVLGERPMSQRRDALRMIEREAGLEGLILRPLSARVLEPTIPEKRGWVNREKLLDIQGRSRKQQMKTAREWNINDYPCPAGGCRLTEKGFAKKVVDLIEHGMWNPGQAAALMIGRHFRLAPDTKVILGRNEGENNVLAGRGKKGDVLLEPADFPGPTALVTGRPTPEDTAIAARLVASYTKNRKEGSSIRIVSGRDGTTIEATALPENQLIELRI